MPGFVADIFARCGNLVPQDTGRFSSFSGKGMHYELHTFDFGASAHISLLEMRAYASLMKMESLVCTSYGKDLPLYSLDRVYLPGKVITLVEFYDTQMAPVDLSALDGVKAKYGKMKDKPMAPQWYDALRLSPSCSKTGTSALSHELAADMTAAFAALFATATPCDRADKTLCNSKYVEELISRGGPAINQVCKIFGQRQDAEELFRKHIFGTQY